jgi:hypothetical protein
MPSPFYVVWGCVGGRKGGGVFWRIVGERRSRRRNKHL